MAPVTLGPDFRQDDGVGERGGLPLEGRGWPAMLLLAPAWPIILRHPDEGEDPEPWSAAPVTLGPDFRQDDGVVGAWRLAV